MDFKLKILLTYKGVDYSAGDMVSISHRKNNNQIIQTIGVIALIDEFQDDILIVTKNMHDLYTSISAKSITNIIKVV